MSAWIEIQQTTVANPVYVGPGSQILNSWIFDAGILVATIWLIYWGMTSGVFPRP